MKKVQLWIWLCIRQKPKTPAVPPNLVWFLTIKVVVWQGGNNFLPEALQRDNLQQQRYQLHSSAARIHLISKTGPTCSFTANKWQAVKFFFFIPATLCGWDLAQFSSLAKTPSLHSMIQCSSMGRDSILVAAIAMPKPISRTRPPATTDTRQSKCDWFC